MYTFLLSRYYIHLLDFLNNDLVLKVTNNLKYLIQAETQEVKRQWVQHLKILILENHTAKIPQTVIVFISVVSDING